MRAFRFSVSSFEYAFVTVDFHQIGDQVGNSATSTSETPASVPEHEQPNGVRAN